MFLAQAAYGRGYECQTDAMSDWEAGKDFKLVNGPYFSIRDFADMKLQANIDKVMYNEDYVLEIQFYSFSKKGIDRFFVNFDGLCVLSI